MINSPDFREVRKTISRCTKLASDLAAGPCKDALTRAASLIHKLARRPLGDPLKDSSFEAHTYMVDRSSNQCRTIFLDKNGDVLGYLITDEDETYKLGNHILSHYDKIAGVPS